MRKRIKDLAFKIKVPKEDLLELSKALSENENLFYRNWEEPKKDEKGEKKFKNGLLQTRPINAPIERLKKIQSKLLNQVLYELALPESFFGGVKGKDAVLNARLHQGNKFFFLTDLKDFYPSISSKRVEQALRKNGFYPDVARIITRLCTKLGAIPQGCPTSSFLAALVVEAEVGDLLDKYRSEGLKVSIYVDDITISSPLDFQPKSIEIIEELRERGLKINFDKTKYCTKNPLVTGVVVKNNGIVAPSHTFERSKDNSRTEESRKGHSMRIAYIARVAKNNKKT